MSDKNSKEAVPSLIPNAGERGSYRRVGRRRPAASGGGSSAVGWWLSLLLLLALAVGGAGGYWLWDNLQQASVRLLQQDKALESVRKSLSSTHIDISQHSKGLRGQLDELIANQAASQQQLKTLVTRLADIDQGHQQLVARQQQLVERQQSVAEQNQQLARRQQSQDQQWKQRVDVLAAESKSLREGLNTMTVRSEAVDEKSSRDSGDLSASLSTVRANLRTVSEQLAQLAQSMTALERRISLNEEWIEGINAYRRQVNDRLFRMQQLLVNRVGIPAQHDDADDAGLQAVMPTDNNP